MFCYLNFKAVFIIISKKKYKNYQQLICLKNSAALYLETVRYKKAGS